MKNYPETADIETASDDYATRFAGEVGKYFLEMQLQPVLRLLESYESPSILDVGGGHAQLAVPLIENGYQVTVTGSDNSCENRLKRFLAPASYTYKTCDNLNLPFADKEFDVVLAFRLVPHVEKWQKLICELARVAKSAVIIDYPDIRSSNILNDLLFSYKKSLEGNTRPFTLYTRRQIRDEFSGYGFSIQSFAPEFFLPMVIHRKVGSVFFSRASEKIFRLFGLTRFFGSPIVVHAKRDSQK